MRDQYSPYYILIVPFCILAWRICRPRYLLAKWAAANGFKILHIGNSFFWQNTFSHTWRRHADYRLEVRDTNGRTRRCNIRIIDSCGGNLEEKFDVEWIDMP